MSWPNAAPNMVSICWSPLISPPSMMPRRTSMPSAWRSKPSRPTSRRLGAVVHKALTIKSGQTHMHRYMRPLLARIQNGEIDPSFIVTHRLRLDDAPQGYEMFRYKLDNCIKVVLKPHDNVVPHSSSLY